MKRVSLLLLFVGLGFLLLSNQSLASISYLSNASVDANDGVNGPPLPPGGGGGVTMLIANGRVYTNTIPVPGGPVGNDVRTILAFELTTASNDVNFNPVLGPGAANTHLLVLGAVEGIVVNVTGNLVTANFNLGRVGLFAAPANYNSNNPNTWGLGGGIVPLSVWDLKPREAVQPDTPNPALAAQHTYAAAQVNQSSVDSQVGSTQSEGRFLFKEASPPDAVEGDNFITVFPTNPVGNVQDEGIFAGTGQQVEGVGSGVLDNAGLGILNSLAAWAGLLDLGGAGTAWATGLGGAPVTDWNPLFTGGNPNINLNGDFRARVDGAEFDPMYQVVPEPTSLLVWGCLGLLGVVLGTRLRRRG